MADTEKEPTSEPKTDSGWRAAKVPTEGMPNFAKTIYGTAPGKMLYYVASDAGRFLRFAVIAAAILGLLFTIFNVWSIRRASTSGVLSTFFYDLLITLVAVGVLYALRVVAEQAEGRRK